MTPTEALAHLGLTVRSKFVPWSQSRNRGEVVGKRPCYSLNWRVTPARNGRDILTTDYSAGIGHIPHFKLTHTLTADRLEALKATVETGRNHFDAKGEPAWRYVGKHTEIWPKAEDVMYLLSMDSDVLDYPTYEEWAANYGCEPDSRKGEAIYRACLEIALKLRAAIGESGLAMLREVFQDY